MRKSDNSPISTERHHPLRHIWQFGHVGQHREYGIVTLYDVEESIGRVPTPDDARLLHFTNADGIIHTQRDNGRDPIGVTFLYDSGYVDPSARTEDCVFLCMFIQAFRDGKFDKPGTLTEPVDQQPVGSLAFEGSIVALSAAVGVSNPDITITWDQDYSSDPASKADGRIITLKSKHEIDMTSLLSTAGYKLEILRLSAHRSGPNAVVKLCVIPSQK